MLDINKIKSSLKDIFTIVRKEPDPDNPGEFRLIKPTMTIFAKELSDAYSSYCEDARTYANDSLLSDGKSAMKAILETLDAPGNTGSFVSLVVSNSIVAFWGSSAFNLAPFPPGFSVVTTITITPPTTPSAPGIEASILAGGESEVVALAWATAIHQQTLSVKTTHIGFDTTLPTPLPKTESDKPIQ